MKKETYNSLKEKAEVLSKLINGGKGSGNFGHGGRPGKVGGSSQSGGGKSTKKDSKKSGDTSSKRELQIEGAQSRIKGLSDRIDALEKGMADDAKKGYTESHARDVEVLQDLKRQLTEANVDKLHYETGIDKEDLRDHEHRKGVIKEFKRGVENLQSRLDSQKRARDSYIKIGASKKEADEMYGDVIKDTEYALGRMKRRVLQTETMIKDMDHIIATRKKFYSK